MATGLSKTKWNGTVAMRNAEQASVVLSYEGKTSEKEILSTAPAKVQQVYPMQGKATDTKRLYFGDNLEILALLLRDPAVKGKVTLIYIDPPYATNSVFQSRSQEDAYVDLLTGNTYLEFLRKRLVILRELLSDSGSIYVHLDDKMVFPVKLLLDEVFGGRNFRNLITRKKCNPKNYTRKAFGNISDYILFYTKTDKYTWHRPVLPWDDLRIKKEYNYIDPKTGRRYKKVPVHAPGARNGETGKPWRGKLPPPGKHWQYRPSTLDEMDKRGEIYWSPNGNPRRKIFFDQNGGIPLQDIWLEYRDAHNQNIHITGYPTEKNLEMLKLIVEASSNEADIVVDCFAGSGTTLIAANNLQRNWIGIDNSPQAIKTIVQRFHFGTKPMGDFVDKKDIDASEQIELSLAPRGLIDSDISSQNVGSKPIEDYSLFTVEEHIYQLPQLPLPNQVREDQAKYKPHKKRTKRTRLKKKYN
jgi:adenine-specific DNA-methyltransferase